MKKGERTPRQKCMCPAFWCEIGGCVPSSMNGGSAWKEKVRQEPNYNGPSAELTMSSKLWGRQ